MNAPMRYALMACSLLLVLSCTAGPGSGVSVWNSAAGPAPSWAYVGDRNLSASGSMWPVIAFSASGTPYVGCRDWGAGGDLTVHRFDGTAWQTVGWPSHAAVSGVFIGDPPQMVIGPDGNPIVAYENSTNYAEVKRFDGTQWVPLPGTSAIVSDGIVNSVALAIAGSTVYCAYQDDAHSNRLTVRVYDAPSQKWSDLGVGFSVNPVDIVHISVDRTGRVWVVFEDIDGYNALSLYMWNGSWSYIPHFRGTSTSATSSIGVDAAGVAWWAGQDNSIYRARVLKYAGGSWATVGSPGFSTGEVRSASLGFGPGGVPWLAYEDNSLGWAVTVKKFTGTDWVGAGPDGFTPQGLSGYEGSMALAVDPEGNPWVAFEDPDNGGISVMAYK